MKAKRFSQYLLLGVVVFSATEKFLSTKSFIKATTHE